jgi:hypothetical protein
MSRDRQLSAAQRQYESACECCDGDSREARLDAASARAELALAPYADAVQEQAGITRADDSVSASLAESRRLHRVLGPDWADGLPL